jgi:subtilase family serine protease
MFISLQTHADELTELNVEPSLNFEVLPEGVYTEISGYTPSQIRRAYGFTHIQGKGEGQTIAIIDAYGSPTVQEDLDVFSKTFHLPKTKIEIVYPLGVPKWKSDSWALETALDVEWAHAIAPKAKILLVVTPVSLIGPLLSAVSYASNSGAKQISMSWGAREFSTEAKYDSYFKKDISYFASSGDYGFGVLWPAISPNVIAVGGTTLNLDEKGNVLSEIGWAGSGGGASVIFPAPAYQAKWSRSKTRTIPDISYVADPYTGVAVYTSTPVWGMSGWIRVGGTSAGAPQMAAAAALINEELGTKHNNLSMINKIYRLAGDAPSINSSFYTDITSGCNINTSYKVNCAANGYDTVTGLGTPAMQSFIPMISEMGEEREKQHYEPIDSKNFWPFLSIKANLL